MNRPCLAAGLALALAATLAAPAGAVASATLGDGTGSLGGAGSPVTAAAPAPAGVFRHAVQVGSLPGVSALRVLTAAEQQDLLRTAAVPAGATGVVETSFAALGNVVVVSDVTATAEAADAWVRLVRFPAGATSGEVLLETQGHRDADDEAAAALATDTRPGPVKDPSYQATVAPECPTEPVVDQLLKCAAFLYAAYRAGQKLGYDVYQACEASVDECADAYTLVGGVVAAGCNFTRPPNPGPYECFYGDLDLIYQDALVCLTGSSCTFEGRAEPGVTRNCELCSPIYVANRFTVTYEYMTPGGPQRHYESSGGLTQPGGGLIHIGTGTEFDSFLGGIGDDTYECATQVTVLWDVYWNDGSSGTAYVNPLGGGKYMTNGLWTYVHEPPRSCLGLPG